jgi:3-phenylpropionate/trans-cinnamate dioxygenase ferredoxin subunit
MPKPHHACDAADLIADQPRCVRIENVDVMIVRHADQIYAMQNRCGHAGAALHRGDCTDGLIVCPLHGAAFRLATGAIEWPAIIPPPMATYSHSDDPRLRKFGELLEAIETLPIRTFPVTVRDGAVYVTMPPLV